MDMFSDIHERAGLRANIHIYVHIYILHRAYSHVFTWTHAHAYIYEYTYTSTPTAHNAITIMCVYNGMKDLDYSKLLSKIFSP